ncbi:hypothetical protein Acr_01g0010990 [Actinidia rufa]|uniref:Uncharacterized protein n=1 Tax=Actinidia rufa TaxID=165716 RepID=A0A7J0E4E5_9ERIC|nr:hypothetical protein Acr_01g0010990 [Actinidia rufa]
MGAVKRNFVTSYMLFPDLPRDCQQPLPLVQTSSAVIIPSLLNSYSEVTMSLARIVAVLVSVFTELRHKGLASLLCNDSSVEVPCPSKVSVQYVCIELRCRGPPNLLHSDSSTEVPTLARPDSVIVYFVVFDFYTYLNDSSPASRMEWYEIHPWLLFYRVSFTLI